MFICSHDRFSLHGLIAWRGSRLARAVVALALVCCMCVGVVARPACAVSAGATIAVTGGSIGTAGLGAGAALGSLALPVLGVVGVALLACGVDVALTNASAEAGMTKTEFIRARLGEFAEARGQDVNHLINLMSNHLAVMSDGSIVVGQEAGEVIQQFGSWLYAEDMVSTPGGSSGAGGGLVQLQTGNATEDFYSLTHGTIIRTLGTMNYTISCVGNSPVYMCWVGWYNDNSFANLLLMSSSSFSYTIYSNNNVYKTGQSLANTNSKYYIYDRINGTTVDFNTTMPINNDISYTFYYNWDGTVVGSGSGSGDIGEDVFTGAAQDWTDNKDLLIPGSGEATIVTGPDVINPAATAVSSGDYTISVPDYLDALARAYNAGADAAIDVALTNTATGALTNVATTDVAGDTATIARDTATAATDAATPFAASGVAVDGPGAIDAMSVPGLAGVFPFCIPYDVRDMLALLSADPVAPAYHVSWAVPYFDDPIEFDVDLSGWNGVAAVLRTMELLAFTIGLAVNTRQLFLRG